MNAINKALPPVRFVGNGRKRALKGVKPLCTMQGGSDMQENHLLKRQSPLYPGMTRGGSLFLYPTPRGAGRVYHAGVIYRGMAALHVCAVPAALYVCEAMARGGGGAHGAYWCLLFVLIRQGLRGGSGPQRLIRAPGIETGDPILTYEQRSSFFPSIERAPHHTSPRIP